MSTTTIAPTNVEQARAAVLEARTTVEEWKGRITAAHDELAELEQSAGERILADPISAEAIESRLTTLRSTARAAERALDAARPKVTAVESRYLAAEAAALEAPLADARKELEEHERKTERLLAQLEKHEGPFVSEYEKHWAVMSARSSTVLYVGEVQVPATPKSHLMKTGIRVLEDKITILREMVAGRDPREWERQHRTSLWGGSQVEYPACVVGPDALVPTVAYLESIERMRKTVRELEELQDTLPREIEEWEDKIASDPHFEGMTEPVARRRARLAEVPGELAAARAGLEALVGAGGDV